MSAADLAVCLEDFASIPSIVDAVQELVSILPVLQPVPPSMATVSSFKISRKDTLAEALTKCKAIVENPKEVNSFEAMYTGLLLTSGLNEVDRVPVHVSGSLRASKAGLPGQPLRHWFLLIRCNGLYGLTGQSVGDSEARSSFHVPCTHASLASLCAVLLGQLERLGCTIDTLNFGTPVPHDLARASVPNWNYLVLDSPRTTASAAGVVGMRAGSALEAASALSASAPLQAPSLAGDAQDRLRLFDKFVVASSSSLRLLHRHDVENATRIDWINLAFHLVARYARKGRKTRSFRLCEGVTWDKERPRRCTQPDGRTVPAQAAGTASKKKVWTREQVDGIVARLTSRPNFCVNEHRRCECPRCVLFAPVARPLVVAGFDIRLDSLSSQHLSLGGKSALLAAVPLRIVSYSILAPHVAAEYGVYCPAEFLAWNYRAPRLIVELLTYEPDVICLQDVDESAFKADLLPRLNDLGFDGTLSVTPSGTGCAVFYARDSLVQVEYAAVHLPVVAQKLSPERTHPAHGLFEKASQLVSNCTAQFLLLREKRRMPVETDTDCVVCNAQLLGSSSDVLRTLHTLQLYLLMTELSSCLASWGIAARTAAVIICGDLGGNMDEAPASLLLGAGQLPDAHPFPLADARFVVDEVVRIVQSVGPFLDAYSEALRGRRFYSTMGPAGCDRPDFVLYAPSAFHVKSILAATMPTKHSVPPPPPPPPAAPLAAPQPPPSVASSAPGPRMAAVLGLTVATDYDEPDDESLWLPNAQQCSDHLALVVELWRMPKILL